MTKQMLNCIGSALLAFVVAFLCHVTGFFPAVATAVCAIWLLSSLCYLQNDRFIPPGGRAILGGIAIFGTGLFGLIFLNWGMLCIYLLATAAGLFFSIGKVTS